MPIRLGYGKWLWGSDLYNALPSLPFPPLRCTCQGFSDMCQGASNMCPGASNTCQGASNTCQGSSNTRQGASNTRQGASNTCQRSSSAYQDASNTCLIFGDTCQGFGDPFPAALNPRRAENALWSDAAAVAHFEGDLVAAIQGGDAFGADDDLGSSAGVLTGGHHARASEVDFNIFERAVRDL
jgi:hypothetical protein